MRKILAGMILGALLACISLWMLGYVAGSDKSGSSAEFEELRRTFSNKTLVYRSEDAASEICIYGKIALIRNMKKDSPSGKEINYNEAQSIWDQFERLPGLQEFKNPKSNEVRSTLTHYDVHVSYGPFGPEVSYSIPKDEKREEHLVWRNLIESTVRKNLREQGSASNGG